MRFAISDLLWTMAVAALLFSLLRMGSLGFFLAFIFLNFLQVLLPVGILVAIIALAEQRGPMLDYSTVPGWRIFKKVWWLSMLCTLLVWILLLIAIWIVG
jgi:hypothetical protein